MPYGGISIAPEPVVTPPTSNGAVKTSAPTVYGGMQTPKVEPDVTKAVSNVIKQAPPPTNTGISNTPLPNPQDESAFLNTTSSSLDTRNKDLTTHGTQLSTLKPKLDTLGTSYDKLDKTVQTKKAELDASEKELQSYSKYNMAPPDMIDAHNEKIDAYNEALTKLQDISVKYKQINDSYNGSVSDYKTKSDQYNSDVTAYQTRADLYNKGNDTAPHAVNNGLKMTDITGDGSTISKGNKNNIPGPQVSIPDIISGAGTYETNKLARENPTKVDPMMYLAKGLGLGWDPINEATNWAAGFAKVPTLSDLPEPSTFAQGLAQTIGTTLTIAIASPAINSVLASAISKIPGGASLLSKLADTAVESPWLKGYPIAIGKAFLDGSLFGLITKNKQSIVQNVLQTGGSFAAFEALAYPVLAFFKPVLQSVGKSTLESSGVKLPGNVDVSVDANKPISKTLWFKNPNDETQFLKVTASGVEFTGKSGIVEAGTKITDIPTITKLEIEGFKQNPSLYEQLKGWVAGNTDGIKDVPFTESDVQPMSAPDETTMAEHFAEARNAVETPAETPMDHNLRIAKITAAPIEPQVPRVEQTQKERVMETVKDAPLSIKEVAKLTKILEPNIRRILGQGTKEGTFTRVSEGTYVLKTKAGNFAYVEMGDAVESLARMASEGQKFHSVILDSAYFSRALIGGNRGIKGKEIKKGGWNEYIMPDNFTKVMDSISKLMASDDAHVYLMLSGARTAQVDMQKYAQGATDAGFKVVGEGKFTKLFQTGKPVTNVRGEIAASERLILLTKSGTAREGEIPKNLNFQFVRPSIAKSYQTEKPAELMSALIQQSTLKGETVLDPFGGSGVTGAEALKSGRNAVIIEKQKSSVEEFTKPRIEATAEEMNKTYDQMSPDEQKYILDEINSSRVQTPLEMAVNDMITGKQKFRAGGKDLKTEKRDILGGHQAFLFRNDANLDTLDTVASNAGVSSDELLQEYMDKKLELQGGFANFSQMADDVKKVVTKATDYIEQTNKNVSFSKDLDDTLYKGTKNAEADTILNHQLQDSTKNITPTERANILDYRDKQEAKLPVPKLTQNEQQINDHLINPLYKDSAQKIAYIKNAGVPFSAEDYSHRLIKGKGSALDKIVASKDKLFPKGGGPSRNILKKSAPSLKHREMFNLTNNATGKRMVVHIPGTKDGNVTGFNGKELTNLGSKKSSVTPRTKEFFDEHVTPVLEKVARDIGVKHETVALKGKKAGLSHTGKSLIQTHPGAPERVLIHEIGHQIDEKYGLQSMIPETPLYQNQLRAVADLRVGETAPKSFKSYARKAEEKMAVMFEAYLHVPEQFQEVAPQLFDTFTAFLGRHAELAPILDIEKSLELGMKKTGGEHVGGKKGNQFVDTNGNKYTISQATIAEIEQHSNVEYYHDPVTAAIFAHDDITRAFRAVQLLESLKNDPMFSERTFKVGEGLPPEGWRTVNLDQFRGYYFEPHTANILNAFAQDLKSSDPNKIVSTLSAINNFLVSTMFLSPVKHLMNVGTSAIINRGATRWLNPLAYPVFARTSIAAIKSIVTQDEDYIKILRAGGPMMAARVDMAKYRQEVLTGLGEKVDPYKKISRKIIKVGAAVTPFNWAHALTWHGNDMIIQQQIREELAKQGLTVKSATMEQIEATIHEVTKLLPSYRLPVAVRLIPRYVTKNTLLFASYRYNLIKSFFELGKTLATGNEPGMINMGSRAWKARGEALNKILVMAFLSIVAMAYVNKKIKDWTQNDNSYLSDPGQLSVIDNINKLTTGKIDITQYIQTMVDLPPATKELLQQFGSNTDWFTGKNIVAKGATMSEGFQQRLAHAETTITPYDLTQRISGGTMTIGELLRAQFGIHTPKGNNLLNILNGSSSNVIDEITRLNTTKNPPSSIDIQKRPDVQIFKSEVTPDKYNEAIKQFTGLFTSNVAKLMDGQFVKPATATKSAYKMDYQNATDDQKSRMIDTVKDLSLKQIETAYHYNKGTGVKGKAVFEGQATKYGIPTVQNLSRSAPDDGTVEKKNPKGEPYYKRFSLAESDAIRDKLYETDSYWKDNGYAKTDVQLDHIVPIETGGTMTENNLMLISKMSDQLNQAFEDYLGLRYKSGTISRADAIRASVDYKINKSVSLTDIQNGKY